MNRVIITRPEKSKKIKLKFNYDKKIINSIKKTDSSAFYDKPNNSWFLDAYKLKKIVENFKNDSIYFKLTAKMANYLGVNHFGETPEEVQAMEKWLKNHPSNAKTIAEFDESIFNFSEDFSLYDYQKAGIAYGISKNGRVLIADEMGLGKTIQAIGLMRYYEKHLPAVIVAPASLLYNWKKEILQWLPDYNSSDVTILQGEKDIPRGKVCIISYHYAAENAMILSQYLGIRGILIVDEAHNIKTIEAKRTQAIMEIAHSSLKAIFLTGTPVLNRIAELFPVIHSISPELFPNAEAFFYRYCNAQITKYGLDISGASHINELLHLLRDNIMVRRMKADVLTQLPEKRRASIGVDVSNDPNAKLSDDLTNELIPVIKENLILTNYNLNETKQLVLKHNFGNEDEDKNAKKMAFEAYRLSGLSKVPFCIEWIENKLNYEIDKLLVFGHHEEFLNAMEEKLISMKVGYIRIDGTTKKEKRFQLVEDYQSDDSLQVALLSINAASVGLTFTAASDTLTGELPYTPGIALQSEDRTHRNGQKNACNIYYPIANNRIDPSMWQNLNTKNETSNMVLDGGMGTTLNEDFNLAAEGILESLIYSVYKENIKG